MLLPAAKDIKARWMKSSRDPVEAFMKDIQADATSFPGKAFEMTFEMPENEVGVFMFSKCISLTNGKRWVDQTLPRRRHIPPVPLPSSRLPRCTTRI
jgi:hypothetical protein